MQISENQFRRFLNEVLVHNSVPEQHIISDFLGDKT
jgi:hypothetical protein